MCGIGPNYDSLKPCPFPFAFPDAAWCEAIRDLDPPEMQHVVKRSGFEPLR